MARGSCDDRDHIGRMSLFNYLAFTLKCSFISFKVAFVCLVCRKVVQSKYSCFPHHESFFFSMIVNLFIIFPNYKMDINNGIIFGGMQPNINLIRLHFLLWLCVGGNFQPFLKFFEKG